MEAHLIDLAQDSHASLKQRKHALLCLGGSRIDTPGVRDFLVAELERGGEEELVHGCAKALGWLREERAIPSLERYLYRPGKEREAVNILGALGSIGTERARSVLVEFAGGDHPGLLLASAVKALDWSDKNAAREAAKQILQGHRGEALAASHRRTLETVAAR